jgi:hypothetical protein
MADLNTLPDSLARSRKLKLSFAWGALACFLLAFLAHFIPLFLDASWNELLTQVLGIAWTYFLSLGLLAVGIAFIITALSFHNEEKGRGNHIFASQIVGLILILAVIFILYIILSGLGGLS